MKFLRSFFCAVILLLVVSAVLVSQPVAANNDTYPSVSFRTEPPVFRKLSQIPQRAGNPGLSELLQGDEESRGTEEQFELPAIERMQIREHYEHRDLAAGEMRALAAAPSPRLRASFPGIDPPSIVQPDSMIAAGPTRLMAAVNSTVAIYSKAGKRVFQTTFDQWFSPLAGTVGGSGYFDPQLLYDQYQGRWIFVCDARRADRRSWYLLSVSKTSNPQGEWAFWAIDMQQTGGGRVDLWADFPRLGVDGSAVYLTANMFTFRTYIFKFGKIRVLKKSELYNYGALTTYEFSRMVDAGGALARNIHAAHNYGPSPLGYLVNTRNDAGNKITMWAVNTTGQPTLTRIPVQVSSYKTPPQAQQKGGGAVINTATEGTGALSAVFRGGFLYTAHAISHNWGSGEVSALRFYQVDATGKVKQEVTFGSDGLSYYMPALSVNSRGDVVMTFNRSGRNEFAGIFYSGRRAADPLGAFSQSVLLKAGEANYAAVFSGSNIARWGDYAAVAVDPSNQTFWFFNEFVKAATEWNAVIANVSY